MAKRVSAQKLPTGLKGLVELSNPETWLLNVVDAYLLKQHDVKTRIDPGWFHPSSLSNPCDAFVAFEFLGAAKKPNDDPQNIRVLDHGHNRDGAWKTYMEGARLSVVSTTRTTCSGCGAERVDGRHMCIPELRIRGECDDIVEHPQTGERYIAEIKTKRQELWTKLERPDEAHVIQVQPYMVAHGVGQTLIVYENSNTKQVKIHKVDFNPDLWETIQGRIRRILQQLSMDETPVRTPSQWETRCAFYPICAMTNFPVLVDEYREKQGLK